MIYNFDTHLSFRFSTTEVLSIRTQTLYICRICFLKVHAKLDITAMERSKSSAPLILGTTKPILPASKTAKYVLLGIGVPKDHGIYLSVTQPGMRKRVCFTFSNLQLFLAKVSSSWPKWKKLS